MGGSVFSLLQMVRGLDRARYEPFVLFRYDLPARADFEAIDVPTATWASIRGTAEETPCIETPPRLGPFRRSRLYRLFYSTRLFAQKHYADSQWLGSWMRREGFSLLHANNSVTSNVASIVAAARAGIPVVSHQRGFFPLSRLHVFLARRVDRLLCVSEAVREHYVREGLPGTKLQTVYNGIDTIALRPRARDKRDYVRVGWFGRFEGWKGGQTFIDAARIITERRRDVRFLMVGTGSEESRLRAVVSEDPVLRSSITLSGYRDDFLDLLADCDILANTSIEPEPLSRSALEALAFGIPVIASNCGGNPEIVINGKNGFLFEPGDTVGLAGALRRLADEHGLRSSFGAEGRRRAEALFSAERHMHEIETVYGDVTSK
jgi:glycosyltransferase involved in cell wall biosynthesis